MQKIDLHQDLISSYIDDVDAFSKSESDINTVNVGGFSDYKKSDLQIIFASVWPYSIIPDENVPNKQMVKFDKQQLMNLWKQSEVMRKKYDINLILSWDDLEHTKYFDFKLNFVYHLKWMDKLNGVADLDNLRKAWFRSIQPVWEFDNSFAHCHRSVQWWLTEKGKDVLDYLHEHKMIIDTANMNYQSMVETYQFTKKPILNSHTNVFALYGHSRNVADEFLELVRRTEGLIWLSLTSNYMVSLDQEATLETYMAQIKYVKERVGDDHVAFGSGYHGSYFKKLVSGLESVSWLQILEDKVVERFGYKFASKFFWENAYRFLVQTI